MRFRYQNYYIILSDLRESRDLDIRIIILSDLGESRDLDIRIIILYYQT